MKHPREFNTVPFGGLHVMQVDAGTTIRDERTGEEITVDDNTAARKGNVIFCTERTFNALKARSTEWNAHD